MVLDDDAVAPALEIGAGVAEPAVVDGLDAAAVVARRARQRLEVDDADERLGPAEDRRDGVAGRPRDRRLGTVIGSSGGLPRTGKVGKFVRGRTGGQGTGPGNREGCGRRRREPGLRPARRRGPDVPRIRRRRHPRRRTCRAPPRAAPRPRYCPRPSRRKAPRPPSVTASAPTPWLRRTCGPAVGIVVAAKRRQFAGVDDEPVDVAPGRRLRAPERARVENRHGPSAGAPPTGRRPWRPAVRLPCISSDVAGRDAIGPTGLLGRSEGLGAAGRADDHVLSIGPHQDGRGVARRRAAASSRSVRPLLGREPVGHIGGLGLLRPRHAAPRRLPLAPRRPPD